MSTFSLSDIHAAAERKHGSTAIELETRRLVLRNTLSLDDAQYAELVATQERFAEIDDQPDPDGTPELQSAAGDVLRDAVPGPGKLTQMRELVVRCLELWAGGTVDDLVTALDGDLPSLLVVMENHAAGTQLGEAERSAS